MATLACDYSHPNYTLIRDAHKRQVITATGIQANLTFRSRIAAVVTMVSAVVASAATASLILTLTIDGSLAAVLTLGNTANQNGPQNFTLTTNRTLADINSRLEIATPTHATGEVDVVYQYRWVPGSDVRTFGDIV